jgi:hypothetical protein
VTQTFLRTHTPTPANWTAQRASGKKIIADSGADFLEHEDHPPNTPPSVATVVYMQYRLLSISRGMGLISVPSSCSIRKRLNLSS